MAVGARSRPDRQALAAGRWECRYEPLVLGPNGVVVERSHEFTVGGAGRAEFVGAFLQLTTQLEDLLLGIPERLLQAPDVVGRAQAAGAEGGPAKGFAQPGLKDAGQVMWAGVLGSGVEQVGVAVDEAAMDSGGAPPTRR